MNETTPPMRKGYLAGWKKRENPEDHAMDYWFDFRPEKANTWETRQEAENYCTAIFNQFGMNISTVGGDTYLCRSFVVEERGPGAFIVSCEAPFPGVSSVEESSGKTPKP